MTITRAYIEAETIRRAGGYMDSAGMDITTVDGSNVDVNSSIASALSLLQISITDYTDVDDSDLEDVAGIYVEAVLDLTEFFVMQRAFGNLNRVDVRVGSRSQSFSDLREDLLQWLDDRLDYLNGRYAEILDFKLGKAAFRPKIRAG